MIKEKAVNIVKNEFYLTMDATQEIKKISNQKNTGETENKKDAGSEGADEVFKV